MQFLIDVNLPYWFRLWNSDNYTHVKDLDRTWGDHKIWEYAEKNHLTIVTKDADFSHKMMYQKPPPRVIHIRVGNMKIQALYKFLNANWEQITELSEAYKLVNVYQDRIEVISD